MLKKNLKKQQEQPQEEIHKVKEEKPISSSQSIKQDPKSSLQIEHRFSLGEPNTKVYCCKFDQEDKYIACACENGSVRVFDVKSGKLSYLIPSSRPNVPFSYVKWRPQAPQFKTRNIFVTANTDGEVQHFHLTSGKCLGTMKDDSFDPQLYCLDYNKEATKLAVCGSEPTIKIYDEEKRCVDLRLGGEQTIPPGHSSRVYTVKFDKENPNMLLTGGWDYRVIIWDIREKKPVQGIYGPLICGDGIDVFEDNILTSSWTQNNQLQIWDLRNCKLINTVDWDSNLKTSNDPVFLYSGQFSKLDGSLILAGGSNSNEAKIFDRTDMEKAVVSIYDLSREIDTVDFANKGNMFAISGGDGYLRLYTMSISA